MSLASRYGQALRESIEEVALEHVLEPAIADTPVMAPQDQHKGSGYPGQLRESAKLEVVDVPGGFVAVVSFDTPYAVKQHEDPRLEHPNGGKVHFLGDHVKAFTPRMAAEVARRVKAKMAADA